MSVFSEKELDYLAGQRLGRLATIDGDGVPHVVPLGWSYNPALDTIDVGGPELGQNEKVPHAQGHPQGRPGGRGGPPVRAAARRQGARRGGDAGRGSQRGRRAAGADHTHPPPPDHQLGPGRQSLRRPRICMPKEARTMTVRITGIAGSLRRESFNRKLLHAAAHEMPHGAELTVWDGLGAVPPFSEDLEAAPAPAGVTDLRQVIAEAEGLLFATPEYNGSVPGQFKNAIDWASRPPRGGMLQGKPAAVISASPTPHGAAWAQAGLRK